MDIPIHCPVLPTEHGEALRSTIILMGDRTKSAMVCVDFCTTIKVMVPYGRHQLAILVKIHFVMPWIIIQPSLSTLAQSDDEDEAHTRNFESKRNFLAPYYHTPRGYYFFGISGTQHHFFFRIGCRERQKSTLEIYSLGQT